MTKTALWKPVKMEVPSVKNYTNIHVYIPLE